MKHRAPATLVTLSVLLLLPALSAMAKAIADVHGITIETGTTNTRVEVWSPSVVRVVHWASGQMPKTHSLAVIAKPGAAKWQLFQKPGTDTIKTGGIEIDIDTKTGAVTFNRAVEQILAEVPGSTAYPTTFVSGTSMTGSRQSFTLQAGEGLYGLGQHPQGVMNYAGTSVELLQKNGDVAIPVMLSSKGYGLFWDNPAVTNIDAGAKDKSAVTWTSEDGKAVDYYLLAGPEPDDAIAGYRWLTGPAPMFGKWAWGFWQSRERYGSQDQILGVASQYRQMGVPIDGIIQDWQYWPPLNQDTADGGWGSHDFDPARYPNPPEMMKALHDQHFHMIISVWAKFDVTNSGKPIANLQHLEAVNGAYKPAIPYVYPKGQGEWYDAFSAKAREVYWKDVSTHLLKLGLDGWWLDASEAELSGKWGEFRTFTTALGPGSSVFNAYPLEHTTAVYSGQRAEKSDERVFILTRSAYAGQQRNSAVTWSGDIRGQWGVLQRQIPAGLNFVASGIPYWNTDIGGFFGSDPDNAGYRELFTRWFQFGSFCPMFRVHGTDKPKEIWRFDDATQGIMKTYINLRYHLIPYIYSVAWRVTNDGYTMMRPLVMDFRKDPQIANISDQFLSGPALMVCPVTHPHADSRDVYLPAGTSWIDFWTGKSYDGGQQISAQAPIETMPIFVRAGAILPYGPAVQYANEKPNDPLELRIYRGADGDFTLYDDEGDNYDYEKGAHATIPIHWDDKSGQLTIGKRVGTYPGMPKERVFKLVLVTENHGAGVDSTGNPEQEVKYNGGEQKLTLTVNH